MWRRWRSGCASYTDPVEGFWPIFFLLVVLKIPVFGALWLVWWASKAPEVDGAADDSDDGFKRWRPEPSFPRGPRRDPHGGAVRAGGGAPPGCWVFRPEHGVHSLSGRAKNRTPLPRRGTPSRP